MAIKYIRKRQEYVGLSTDSKTELTTNGSVIYYTDLKTREIYNNGSWTEYIENITQPLYVQLTNYEISITKNITNVVTVDDTVGGTVILAENSDRVSFEIQNEGMVNVFIAFGEDPTTSNYSKNIPSASLQKAGDGGELKDDHLFAPWKGSVKGITNPEETTTLVIFEKIKV